MATRWSLLLSSTITTNKLTLEVQDTVLSTLGAPLDGDWVNGSDTYNSGNPVGGAPVGHPLNDFNFQFAVLVGDSNQSGAVNTLDSSPIFSNFGKSAGMPGYSIFLGLERQFDTEHDG